MKKTSIYLAVICLSVACIMGCTPTAKPTASQTAQPTAVDKAELAVKITSDITWDTPDDPESGDVKAIIHGLNDKDQEIWSHTFAIKVLTELSPVSPATLADGRAYIEIERTLYALSLADGSIVWQLDDVGASAGGRWSMTTAPSIFPAITARICWPFPKTAANCGVQTM